MQGLNEQGQIEQKKLGSTLSLSESSLYAAWRVHPCNCPGRFHFNYYTLAKAKMFKMLQMHEVQQASQLSHKASPLQVYVHIHRVNEVASAKPRLCMVISGKATEAELCNCHPSGLHGKFAQFG